VAATGRRGVRADEGGCSDDKNIVRTERVAGRIDHVIENSRSQATPAQVIGRKVGIKGLFDDIPFREIHVQDLAVEAALSGHKEILTLNPFLSWQLGMLFFLLPWSNDRNSASSSPGQFIPALDSISACQESLENPNSQIPDSALSPALSQSPVETAKATQRMTSSDNNNKRPEPAQAREALPWFDLKPFFLIMFIGGHDDFKSG